MDAWQWTVVLVARVLVGGILITAGWAKLRAGNKLFRNAVLAYDLVPHAVAKVIARSLPALEISLGVGLLLGLMTAVSAWLAFALIGVLTVAVVISLARGRGHLCGCLGFTAGDVRRVQWSLAARNLVLMGLVLAVLSSGDAWSVDGLLGIGPLAFPASAVRAAWAIWLLAAVATGIAWLAARKTAGSVATSAPHSHASAAP